MRIPINLRPGGALLLLVVTLGSIFAQTPQQKKALAALGELSNSFEALAEQVAPAVVQIFSTGYAPGDAQTASSILAPQRSSGSGVILDPDGYIITNAHVVEGATRVEVQLASLEKTGAKSRSILRPRGKKLPATILGLDRETDLAVLKIEERNLPYLQLGDSDLLRQGQLVLAFGSPLGLENSVTLGVISSVARQLRPEDPMIYIQTDAPINPGNSGGPLVNTEGQVVGINTLIFTQSGGSEGLGFAAPGNIVRNVFEQIKRHGRVRRGEIGVHPQTITPALAKGLKLPQGWGVVAGDVYPGSPAAEAGLKSGDVIFSLDNKIMENGRQFEVNLYRQPVGEEVLLEVLRGSERLTMKVKVIERPDEASRFLDLADPTENLVPRLGILAIDIDSRVEEMLPRLRKKFGVLVAAISADSPVENGAFYPGDVIYGINGVEITGLFGLRAELEKLRPGDAAAVQIQRRGQLMFLGVTVER